MTLRVCSRPTCPNLTDHGRCVDCRRDADRVRGTRQQRGYTARHQRRFRTPVLRRDPLCVCMDVEHGHPAPCGARSVHADHHPMDRRELVRRGLDADDPQYGRGLCPPCHSKHTAQAQPGGWAAQR